MLNKFKKLLVEVPRYSSDIKLSRRAEITNLMILLSSFIISFDFYNSIIHQHQTMAMMEAVFLALALFTFLSFKSSLDVRVASNVIVGGIAFLSLISLSVEGYGKESAIFWTATLPLYFYFFLDVKDGLKWTFAAELVLILTLINTIFNFYPPLFSSDLLIQLVLGFAGVSYLFYHFELSREKQEHRLETALSQKEILNKEVHHRVKNNLQFVVALLSMQAAHDDEPTKYDSSINRLISLAQLHNLLYDSSETHDINTKTYFTKIAQHLIASNNFPIELKIDVDAKISLTQNLFCGLLLNELITNSIKHAFTGDDAKIEISLEFISDEYVLSVKDNGIGYNKDNNTSSFGTILINILVYDQLSGSFEYTNGVHIIKFRDEQ